MPLLYDSINDKIKKDLRVTLVPVGCGNCIECRKKKARDWQIRLQEDIRKYKNGKFITLTFNTESLQHLSKIVLKENKKLTGYDLDNAIATKGIRRFLERWRKKHKKSIRHWLVSELGHGSTEHIHLHGIIFTNENIKEIEEKWGYGYVWEGTYVNEKTVNYIIKYIHKMDIEHKEYKSIIRCTAGIGNHYFERTDWERNKFKGKDTIETYKTRQGKEIALPIYYRNKIYNEIEREELWLNKIDEEIRYILGSKIDTSKNETEYYKHLEDARKINNRLGYGNNEINWDRKTYERNRRILKHEERIGVKKDNNWYQDKNEVPF